MSAQPNFGRRLALASFIMTIVVAVSPVVVQAQCLVQKEAGTADWRRGHQNSHPGARGRAADTGRGNEPGAEPRPARARRPDSGSRPRRLSLRTLLRGGRPDAGHGRPRLSSGSSRAGAGQEGAIDRGAAPAGPSPR
jgi:hypothetical protein